MRATPIEPFHELVTELMDPDFKICKAAAGKLRRLYGSQALPPLLALLQDERAKMRICAAEELGKLKNTQAVQPLLQALNDPGIRMRYKVIEALGALQDASAAPALVSKLHDPSEEVQVMAIKTLGALGNQSVLPDLLELLEFSTEHVLCTTINALGNLGGEAIIDRLLEMVKLTNPEMTLPAHEAVYTLAQIGSPQAVNELLKLYKQPVGGRDLRYTVVGALGQLQQRDSPQWQASLRFLLERLQAEEEVALRVAILNTLSLLNDQQAVEPLIDLLTHPNTVQKKRLLEELPLALARLKDQRAVEPLLDLLETYPEYAAPALGLFGDVRAVEPLIRRLNPDPQRPHDKVQLKLIHALGELGDPRAREPLSAFTGHPLTVYQWAARQAIKKLRKK